MNKDCSKKDKTTKQLKKALAKLDIAVQKWYKVHAPLNEECYASCHIRNYPDGSHASEVTLLPKSVTSNYVDITSNYVDIRSSKDRR